MKSKIFYFVLGAIIFGSIGAYAATTIASANVTYTNNGQENVQGAIDDLFDKAKNHCPEGKACMNLSVAPKCVRATTLHNDGTHTFGNNLQNIVTGTLTSGDAFDCDVNGDGYYDPLTERFYYISEYYNTSTKEFEDDTVVLIYYNNTKDGVRNNTSGSVAYNIENSIYDGPITAKLHLPTTSQWTNVNLRNTTRNILDSSNQIIKSEFSYEGYAARLLTYQELKQIGDIKPYYVVDQLIAYDYLLENTVYSGGLSGYWLETINTSAAANVISGHSKSVDAASVNEIAWRSVRPVIEISINDIKY